MFYFYGYWNTPVHGLTNKAVCLCLKNVREREHGLTTKAVYLCLKNVRERERERKREKKEKALSLIMSFECGGQ